MPVDDPAVIDIMSVNPVGNVVLTISDHLEWSDSVTHQHILQEKINRYVAFVESGEILEHYADAPSRGVVIRVVTQFGPDADGQDFLERAKAALERAGVRFEYRHLT